MHELMLAESVITMVEAAARQAQATRVTRVKLALGRLAHIEPDTLVYCCQLVGRDGVAAQAEFEVERRAGLAWCKDCAQEVALAALGLPCPLCGAYQLSITGGDEMQLIDIAVI